MEIIISNPKNLEKLKTQIKKDGYQNLHILSDFDRTLTYGNINGIKTPSIISLLRDGNHLTKDYADKANALFEKYHQIEIDPKISLIKKKEKMQEWWQKHNKLLIDSGLEKKDLQDIVEKNYFKFRKGVLDFLDFLYKNNIPLIIISASGCGEVIKLFFQKNNRDYSNIFYITNHFYWDKNGKAVSVKDPIIHSMNKDETILEKIPKVYNIIKNRKNVILLGDNIEDIEMITGFNYEKLLKIGFLNFDCNKTKEKYKKNFDVVLSGDKDFYFVNNLIKEIFG